MTNWFFLISTLAVVYCRPQYNTHDTSAVEFEKQRVVELFPEFKQLVEDSTQKHLEEKTKQILEKIAEVNEKQGLNKKITKPNYHHFPISYLRSQQTNPSNRQSTGFKFPRDPFTNPILDYIEGEQSGFKTNSGTPMTGIFEPHNYNVMKEDEIPGQYIKRKITHHQTMLIPSPGYLPASFNPGMSPMQPNIPQYSNVMNNIPDGSKVTQNNNDTKKNELEKQTIDNVKSIVGSSQYASTFGFNPYIQPFNPYAYYQQVPSYPVYDNYRLYGPYSTQQLYRPGRQWQWPLNQYFPIVIKDPIMHMFNAMTSIVEYGPQASAGSGNACSKQDQNPETLPKVTAKNDDNASSLRARTAPENSGLTYDVVNSHNGGEITVLNDDNSNLTTILDIEDLQISNDDNNPIKLNLSYRKSKQYQELTKTSSNDSSKAATDLLNHPLIQTLQVETARQSPPLRDQTLHEDELENEEDEKAVISNDGNKKMFSKDNTGSGIFIHKLKVRKGGVAIAGPGGIATAGSGGTAIVGPNGFAYTHPDSLAIAGSGTKVVAVEPTINLSDIIQDSNLNKTRGHGHSPRYGKIVAVGPVIYYNKG